MLSYRRNGQKGINMKALNLEELYDIPARMEDIPLYVKEYKSGNIHVYGFYFR